MSDSKKERRFGSTPKEGEVEKDVSNGEYCPSVIIKDDKYILDRLLIMFEFFLYFEEEYYDFLLYFYIVVCESQLNSNPHFHLFPKGVTST